MLLNKKIQIKKILLKIKNQLFNKIKKIQCNLIKLKINKNKN